MLSMKTNPMMSGNLTEHCGHFLVVTTKLKSDIV